MAERHYLQVTDEHFAKAIGKAQHMAQQQAPQHSGTEGKEEEQECENSDDFNNRRDSVDEKVGVTGTELIAESSAKRALSKVRAADSGAVSLNSSVTDPMLAIVMASWPRLSTTNRTAIVGIVRAAVGPSDDE